MVDAADPEKIEASKNELHNLLDKPQLQGIPVRSSTNFLNPDDMVSSMCSFVYPHMSNSSPAGPMGHFRLYILAFYIMCFLHYIWLH